MRNLHSIERRRIRTLLYDIRMAKGLLQVDLAKRLNCHQSFISKYESGERRLDIIDVKLICNALGMDLVTFCKKFEGQHDCE